MCAKRRECAARFLTHTIPANDDTVLINTIVVFGRFISGLLPLSEESVTPHTIARAFITLPGQYARLLIPPYL